MSYSLTNPLDVGKMRYCSACDNCSATYAGRFIGVPTNPDTRLEWLVRMGVMKRTDPLPRTKGFFICDNHFDKERDFFTVANGSRLRSHTLPWRNLKTGTYSYHGCDHPVQSAEVWPCPCACCKRTKAASFATTVTIQTDDVECSRDEPDRFSIPEVHCRLCLRGVRATSRNLRRLFCENTKRSVDPELMERLYVTTGLMIHWNQEPDAMICSDCAQQAEQAHQFRLQSRSNHRMYLASLPKKKRKELYQEHVQTKSSEIREDTEDENLIEQIKLNPTEQVHNKIEPDLPPRGVSKRPNHNAGFPVGLEEIKSEPELIDHGQIATCSNLSTQNEKPIQIVNFQEFVNMLAKIKAEKGNSKSK